MTGNTTVATKYIGDLSVLRTSYFTSFARILTRFAGSIRCSPAAEPVETRVGAISSAMAFAFPVLGQSQKRILKAGARNLDSGDRRIEIQQLAQNHLRVRRMNHGFIPVLVYSSHSANSPDFLNRQGRQAADFLARRARL